MKRFFLILFLLILSVQAGDVCAQSITWQREYNYIDKTEGEVICQILTADLLPAEFIFIHLNLKI